MTGRLKDLTINSDESQNITVTVDTDFREMFDKLKDGKVNIEIKRASNKRSLDANSYLWHLCGEIAKASSEFSTDGKNDIYRKAIRAKGEFEEVKIKECAIETFISKWSEKGTGWFAEVIDDEPEDYDDLMGDARYKVVHVYYGSSTYDSAAMNRIIDYVVMIANDLDIPTITDSEKKKLIGDWGRKVSK